VSNAVASPRSVSLRAFDRVAAALLPAVLVLVTATSAAAQDPQISAPVISGTALVGEVLSATTGDWTPHSGTPTYQWFHCDANGAGCAPVSGVSSPTPADYVIVADDMDHTLRLLLTVTDVGQASAWSSPTAIVPRPPANVARPAIGGAASAGNVLTASPGTWSGTPPLSFRYSWHRCDATGLACMPVAGATTAGYALSVLDIGATLRVAVSASNAGGTSPPAVSRATAVVTPAAVQNVERPAVDGVAAVGRTLTATSGRWSATGPLDLLFRWLRCDRHGADCRSIAGAFGRRYVVRPLDVGRRLRVRVTAIGDGGSLTRASGPTAIVAPPPDAEDFSFSGGSGAGEALMRPFPRVRIKGYYTSAGAAIALFTVRGPKWTRIALACRGKDCPFHQRAMRARARFVRIRSLERWFDAGTRLKIRITKRALIGKYARILIRGGRPPTRRDRCLVPGSVRPAPCPSPSA
jgi:hypothetical protein